MHGAPATPGQLCGLVDFGRALAYYYYNREARGYAHENGTARLTPAENNEKGRELTTGTIILFILAAFEAAILLLLVLVLARNSRLTRYVRDIVAANAVFHNKAVAALQGLQNSQTSTERSVRETLAKSREEMPRLSEETRIGIEEALKRANSALLAQEVEASEKLSSQLSALQTSVRSLTVDCDGRFEELRTAVEQSLAKLPETQQQVLADAKAAMEERLQHTEEASTKGWDEASMTLCRLYELLRSRLNEVATSQQNQVEAIAARMAQLNGERVPQIEEIRRSLAGDVSRLETGIASLSEGLSSLRHMDRSAEIEKGISAGLNQTREEFSTAMTRHEAVLNARLTEIAARQESRLNTFAAELAALREVYGTLTQTANEKMVQAYINESRELRDALEQQRAELTEMLKAREKQRPAAPVQPEPATDQGPAEQAPQPKNEAPEPRPLLPKAAPGSDLAYASLRPDAAAGITWLPIETKYPVEIYERLVGARALNDTAALEKAQQDLEQNVWEAAREMHFRYAGVPDTSDFVIMFLPVEGLYTEVLRRPGLCTLLHRDFRVVIAGPTTLEPLLASARTGSSAAKSASPPTPAP